MRVGVIVGHEQKKMGAKLNLVSAVNEASVYEYEFNSIIAKQLEFLQGIYGFDLGIFFRDGIGVSGAYRMCAAFKPDIILELHFNSTFDETVVGAEVLCSSAHANNPFPNIFLPRVVTLFGGKNRGLKVPDEGKDRGYGNVNRPIPYFLLEPFFGSSAEQAKIASEKTIDYARAIMDSLKEYDQLTHHHA